MSTFYNLFLCLCSLVIILVYEKIGYCLFYNDKVWYTCLLNKSILTTFTCHLSYFLQFLALTHQYLVQSKMDALSDRISFILYFLENWAGSIFLCRYSIDYVNQPSLTSYSPDVLGSTINRIFKHLFKYEKGEMSLKPYWNV